MSFGPMTGPVPTIVRDEIEMQLIVSGDKSVEINSTFDYSASEPYSIRASFKTADGAVDWVFSRDIISQALLEPAGDGDVSAWVEGEGAESVFCLQLTSPSGQALMETKTDLVREFLNRTFTIVPAGSESQMLNLDFLIERLLDEEGPANIA
ncbi:MAG: SsgA family sporulation/cell division regulator [Candidatus Nanopelagicales bacterium]